MKELEFTVAEYSYTLKNLAEKTPNGWMAGYSHAYIARSISERVKARCTGLGLITFAGDVFQNYEYREGLTSHGIYVVRLAYNEGDAYVLVIDEGCRLYIPALLEPTGAVAFTEPDGKACQRYTHTLPCEAVEILLRQVAPHVQIVERKEVRS